MREQIYKLIENQSDLTVEQIMANIAFSAVLGFFIYLSYYISHRGTIYSRKFNVSLVVLTALTGTVMTVIGNNVALSLGMVGALSIVRFRTAIKDSRDTMYIFWAIIAGICCGVGDFAVATAGSVIVFLILLIFGAIKSDRRMLLIARCERSAAERVQATVFKFFSRKALLRVKNTTDTTVEFIYEITDRMLERAESGSVSVTETIYKAGGVEYVNIVLQNDEIN